MPTAALPPYPAYRPSGVEWLGEIPAHWEVKRLKLVTSFVTSGSRGWAEHYADDGALFLRIGNLSRSSVGVDLSDVQRVIPPYTSEVARTQVRAGDVLISITAYIGSVVVVPDGLDEAYVNQHIALTRPCREKILSRWAAHFLLSWTGQVQFNALLYGGTKDGLRLDDVRDLVLLVPPLHEQADLAGYLYRETTRLDALAGKVGAAIGRLHEYRAALISAAVTGKVDVRGVEGRDDNE